MHDQHQPASPEPSSAVVVHAHTSDLSPDERASLRQVTAVLGGQHTIVLAVPSTLDVSTIVADHPELQVMRFPDEFYGSAAAHSRMLLSSRFYAAFEQFDFVLIHHLDAYVFRDELTHWCRCDFDYVASPWFEDFELSGDDAQIVGVGNGGFSLRKVQTFLRITRQFDAAPARHFPNALARRIPYRMRAVLRVGVLPLVGALRVGRERREALFVFLSRGFTANEDVFWGMRVPAGLPWFRVAPAEVGLAFGFEMKPRQLFERRGHELPFGCHGWPKYDREFWLEHMPET
jgi:Protein of unknown function (DUF5672)